MPYLFYVNRLFRLCKNGLLISFSGQTTYAHQAKYTAMAGVLELIKVIGPQRQLIARQKRAPWVDLKALELQTAMEILAEVFSISISEVEEMLRQRSEVQVQSSSEEGALWPASFCLTE